MRTWTCASALLLVLASSASALALQHQSQCVLPTTWETEVDQQAFANANTACPKAAGRPDSTACLPCVCAAMNLFGDALTHATALTSPRPDMTTIEGTTFASELFGTCIDDNFGSFAQPLKVQQGLKDCLTSADAFISGAQMMEFCGNWGKQAMLTSEEEPIRHVIRDAVEMPHKNVISAAANHARAASEAHARLMHEERFLQETVEESSFEESSGEEIVPPGVYPPPFGVPVSPIPPASPGTYPPLPPGAVYPPISFPPPSPAGGAATISTSNVMLQMAMALLSAVLLAGVMMA